jgi:hypothetical protein
MADEERHEGQEPAVGITNKPLEQENARMDRQQARARGQRAGTVPIGTHEGTTTDEQARGQLRAIDPGTEAARGADDGDAETAQLSRPD